MLRAVELARRGEGLVEPNPMVGCVIVLDGEIISSGYHQKFGAPHAEINAMVDVSQDLLRRSTMYVTLEPCTHQGKTPPCVDAIIAAKPSRVCIGTTDPNPITAGRGVAKLKEAGIPVEVGIAQAECQEVIAPFTKYITLGQPFVIAKWAMTLDGKIATSQGHSKWISNSESQAVVHQIRGRVDGILIGAKTAAADNPMLTARPPGPRIPTRIVLDSKAKLSPGSELIRTAEDYPTIVVCHPDHKAAANRLIDVGVNIIYLENTDRNARISALLSELGGRNMTNVMVEGGGMLLGSFFDARAIDEVHIFVAPKLIGGADAITPIGGIGLPSMDQCVHLTKPELQLLGDNYYVQSRVDYEIKAN